MTPYEHLKAKLEHGKSIDADVIRVDIEELASLIFDAEKQIPQKPILKERQSLIHVNKGNQPHEWISEKYKDWCCPVCDSGVGEQYVPRNHNQRKMNFCWKCGQKIDWNF